ncbi:uncharacterized protein IL334_006458 [Kwoniella shivajii]|uniref:Nicotinamide-nucleotide adenylyltransferase n=1 Tax=Kwoniella shivajii TaxID=564305 RepID=A0ABZ1D608_9TREE|nr:hypothetical protein IL334_006458 [Kwoniella shivajii]
MTSNSSLQETIHRISSTPGSFALVSSTPSWPISPCISKKEPNGSKTSSSLPPIHISILDSSFNPPTTAHQSIAFSTFPSHYPTSSSSSSTSSSSSSNGPSTSPPSYTARLLLFSARNVEKTLKSSDATPSQRVEMMSILSNTRSNSNPDEAVAVGLVNEPTFVGKASIIREYLSSLNLHLQERRIDLTFLVGTDTLVRFFDPRFYPENKMEEKIKEFFSPYPEGSGAYLVSARRGADDTDRALEDEILNRDKVRQWVSQGKVRLLGTGHEGREEISSTKVRQAIVTRHWEQVERMTGKDIAKYIREKGLYSS